MTKKKFWTPTREQEYELLKQWKEDFDKAVLCLEQLHEKAIEEQRQQIQYSLPEAYWQGGKDMIRRALMIVDINQNWWAVINSSTRHKEVEDMEHIGKIVLDRPE